MSVWRKLLFGGGYCFLAVLGVVFFSAFTPPAATLISNATPPVNTLTPNALTLDFGSGQVVLTEQQVQGGWFNYDSWHAHTHGQSLTMRALQMSASDSFAGTFPDLVQALDKAVKPYEQAPDPGRVQFHPHQNPRFTVTRQRPGRQVDRERLYADILQVLRGNKYPVIRVAYQTVPPPDAATIVKNITTRSHFSTHCTDNPEREHNIALALGKFDGLCIQPGASVSFNQIVGARTASQGYQAAKIILNGNYVDGIGGGVCQVSTTLFNAVVAAGLAILQAHPHSLPSSYVPLGHDAMVSSSADLRFLNNSGAPIYLETAFANHTLSVTVYGRTLGPQIRYQLDTVTHQELPAPEQWDSNLTPAVLADYQQHPENYQKVLLTAGQPGYRVTTYIDTYQGQKRLSRKRLRHNTYHAQPHVYTLRRTAAPPT